MANYKNFVQTIDVQDQRHQPLNASLYQKDLFFVSSTLQINTRQSFQTNILMPHGGMRVIPQKCELISKRVTFEQIKTVWLRPWKDTSPYFVSDCFLYLFSFNLPSNVTTVLLLDLQITNYDYFVRWSRPLAILSFTSLHSPRTITIRTTSPTIVLSTLLLRRRTQFQSSHTVSTKNTPIFTW
jgi:hypothetical protein